MKQYTFNAVSKPRKINPKPKPEPIEMTYDISEEVKQNTLDILKEDRKYNIHAVNDFEFIKGYKERRISELDINSKYEFIMMISIMIDSKLPNALFELDLLNGRVIKKGISFNEFILKEKGGIQND
jgi:hypothetical protein